MIVLNKGIYIYIATSVQMKLPGTCLRNQLVAGISQKLFLEETDLPYE